jgi:hypothetical protein
MNRIGPKQRLITDALKAGGELRMLYGEWSLYEASGVWRGVSRERCMGLYVRGFIMHDGETPGGRAIYRLTEKGKQA